MAKTTTKPKVGIDPNALIEMLSLLEYKGATAYLHANKEVAAFYEANKRFPELERPAVGVPGKEYIKAMYSHLTAKGYKLKRPEWAFR